MIKKLLLAIFVLSLLGVYIVGTLLIKAHHTEIGDIPSDIVNVKAVTFSSKSGSEIKGWYLDTQHPKGGVLLLHGVRSNRLQMLNRARFLQNDGYDVLLFDFQAHGESGGDVITFGYQEALDVEAGYEYLQKSLGSSNIAIIGVSLGGASALLSPTKTKAKVMILESVYPSIEQAIKDRLKIYLGSVGEYLSPLLTIQLKPRMGIGIDDLKPINHISQATGAIMIITGSNDQRTTVEESKEMYAKANKPKELWIVKDAKHVNFDYLLGDKYKEKILSFLDKHMNNKSK